MEGNDNNLNLYELGLKKDIHVQKKVPVTQGHTSVSKGKH